MSDRLLRTAASALERAIAVGERYHARVTALHVCSGPPDETETVRLMREVTEARDATPTAVLPELVLAQGDVAHSILKEAERLRDDLLVMGTHGTSRNHQTSRRCQ